MAKAANDHDSDASLIAADFEAVLKTEIEKTRESEELSVDLDVHSSGAMDELDSAVVTLNELASLDSNMTRPSDRFTKGFLQSVATRLEDEATEQDRLIDRYDSLRQIADAGIMRGGKQLDLIRSRIAAVKAALRVIEDASIG
jgi:hypothetical protein